MHHRLDPTPDTVHWGYFDAALKPVLVISSGDTVVISSFTGDAAELPTDRAFTVSDMHRRIIGAVRPEVGPHLLTGPVAIDGAKPGDVLQVDIEDVETIQNWGFNTNKPLRGALPGRFPDRRLYHIAIDHETRTARCPWGAELPLKPFFGIMAVAPPPNYGRVSTIEPREYGGNIDNTELGAGASLFLPVFAPGALFSVGDGHGCQGDGEVNLTALETALRGTFTLTLHKETPLALPRAVTESHFMTMGFDPDLDDAATIALNDMIDALIAATPLDAEEAYAHCSLCCDLRITQVVDGNKGVHAMLPRDSLPSVADTDFVFGKRS